MGLRTNLDDIKVLKSIIYTFSIMGVTETWLKPHMEYGGISLFLTNNMIYSRRNDIIFNSEINSVTVD